MNPPPGWERSSSRCAAASTAVAAAFSHRLNHAFTEPALRPPTKCRWKIRNRMTTGRQPRTLMAIIWFH